MGNEALRKTEDETITIPAGHIKIWNDQFGEYENIVIDHDTKITIHWSEAPTAPTNNQ